MLDEPAGENLLAASWASGTNSANQQDCSQFRNLTMVNAAIIFINKIMCSANCVWIFIKLDHLLFIRVNNIYLTITYTCTSLVSKVSILFYIQKWKSRFSSFEVNNGNFQ